jgi:hypothetical protein
MVAPGCHNDRAHRPDPNGHAVPTTGPAPRRQPAATTCRVTTVDTPSKRWTGTS